ncbi:VOC family protein [Phytomonospora endophytica]|uniref:Catechol 2,3-dioxygenase-like lactoylglutathione lyase family enzyme n=1 Tax=Phytomonospora endophytica TaxID=714109 RepID=A0A841FN54_9ACTN|nr:VOC family protein [Phytomonospora endophytica]MBB6037465.1 catechol 2,3-dioxygenase-like lactoylglutathione lyase family enzyme [Phytomonospora endophytica]GIG70715.1 glyoxalase [Phytomonospora endophytica]
MEPVLDVIAVVVDDMAASLAFYRRLGFDIPASADNEPHVEVTLRGGMRMAWDDAKTIRSFMPEWNPVEGAGRIGMSFLCESPADVDERYAALVEAGYVGEKEPWDAFWGQRYAVVQDPDGNGVDLFAPLDR